ncbi:DUF397 domain-containing protein [Streptomyces sp. NPDC059740]|uniref:DUF397 domain-containing protein n=1 Tax=Streptomyces sp. NPDC059740 TaxID=3346926 RepID=UPI00364B6CFF
MTHVPTAEPSHEPVWFKSSYSSGTDGNSCIEVATTPAAVHVRDSKNAEGPHLTLSPTAWAVLITYAAKG